MKCILYKLCVRSAMCYGVRTWPVNDDDVKRLVHTEEHVEVNV